MKPIQKFHVTRVVHHRGRHASSSIPHSRRNSRQRQCPRSSSPACVHRSSRRRASSSNSDTFVDSITATDIGAFPDKSVAEALQRVPGITVSRLQSSDDSNHFSAEPATVLIRGLTFVRTQFNGRDSFSADGYRGLNFNDVSPELMQGVDTYKNQTAEMIEGGIAGVVNLRTRMPFDSDGQDIRADRTRQLRHALRGADLRGLGCVQQHLGDRQRPLRPAGQRRVLEHRDAHRSGQHDAHLHALLGLSAGWRRIPERSARCRRQRGLQQQSLRRHGLALCTRAR